MFVALIIVLIKLTDILHCFFLFVFLIYRLQCQNMKCLLTAFGLRGGELHQGSVGLKEGSGVTEASLKQTLISVARKMLMLNPARTFTTVMPKETFVGREDKYTHTDS